MVSLFKDLLAFFTALPSPEMISSYSKCAHPIGRKKISAVGGLVLGLAIGNFFASPAIAEGSKELTNNGGNRAFLLYHSGANSRPTIGSIPLRTTIKVYVNAGETINLGSSAIGIGSGAINYRTPTGNSGSCPAPGATNIGKILDRTQEVAGPLPNAGGYNPCVITSAQTTTAGSGIWEIDFVSPNPAVDNNPTGLAANASWTQASNVGWVAAWDVSVRNSGGTVIPGRVFSNSLALRMPPSGASFSPPLYVQTRDGYRYLVNPRNLDPFTFVFFANNNGFKSSTTDQPLYRSVLFPGGTGLEAGVAVHDPNAADSGNNVTHKVFLTQPNPDLPASAPSASGTTWLLQNPLPPTPSNFAFTGIEGTSGNAGTSPLGGNFTFNSNVTGRFIITIDLDRDGIYGNGNDRVLSGLANPGTNTLYWDGKDKNGNIIPAGAIPYGGKIVLNAGEIHFPLLDAEGNPGGITIQRLNDPVPPTNPNPDPYGVYFDDTAIGASSALNGVNSSGGSHPWTSSFGDNKGLDTWTYYPSQPLDLNNGITIRQADLAITKTDNLTTIAAGSSTTYTITVTNNGPSNVTGAQVLDTIVPEITGVTWTCAIATGSGSCGAVSGSGNNINTTVNLNSGSVATYTVTGTVSPTASGTLSNTAKVLRPNDVTDPTDPNKTGAGNNTATDTTTITAPITYNISGTLYQDSDGEDDFNIGEPTLPANITVKLLDSTGTTTIATTTTNASGNYTFTGITNGNYKIQVDTTDTDIPTGFTLGTPNDLAVNVSGSSITNQNFGFDIATGFCNIGDGTPDGAIANYISSEVTNNLTATRAIADTLDDTWRTATGGISTGTIQPWFGTANSLGNVNSFTYLDPATSSSVNTTVDLVQVNITGLTNCSGIANNTSSTPLLSTGAALQDTSPRPTSLYNNSNQPAFWNQTLVSGNDNRRFAARFTFAQPVKSFGAWFGDLETRATNGTPAVLRLLDASGNRIGNDISIAPTTLSDGTPPDPETINQNQCGNVTGGGFTPNNIGCGNAATRWIGFVDSNVTPRVSQVLVIVGDDDFNDNGDTEILSFIGSNLIPIASNPNILLVKRITAINGVPFNDFVDDPNSTNDNDPKWPTPANTYLRGVIDGGVVKPGDELEYTIYFLSRGDGPATNVNVCDLVPDNTTFLPTAFNGLTPTDSSLPGSDLGIALALDSDNLPSNPNFYLSNVADTDRGQFFAPGSKPPVSCSGSNNNGAVVVNLVKKPNSLPNATGAGTPTNSYGFIRFRAVVK